MNRLLAYLEQVYSFKGKANKESASAFIKMCVDISDIDDDEEIYQRAEQVLKKDFRGMRAGAASMVLHCLKPETFPILNSRADKIFKDLGVKLTRKNDIDTYIQNCRAIKAFRDATCLSKITG